MSQRQELQAQVSYQIYALIDPRDSTVHYVAMSRNAQRRLFQHLLGDSRNEDKNGWIRELLDGGLYPTLHILEEIEARREDVDAYSLACERERHWINAYLQSGATLLNDRGNVHHSRRPRKPTKWIEKEPAAMQEPGPALRELREWAVLTQEELARLVGVSVTTISHWETGSKLPRSSKIHNVALALEVDSQELIAAIRRTRAGKGFLTKG
jgi:DNA-binding XRE family transcriptional regulator